MMSARRRAWSAWSGAYSSVVFASSAGALPAFSDLVTPSSTWSQLSVSWALPGSAPPLRIRTRTSEAGALLPFSRAATAAASFFFFSLTAVKETSFLIMSKTCGAVDSFSTTVLLTFSAGLSITGVVVKVRFLVLSLPSSRPRSFSLPMLSSCESTVRALVPASARSSILEGLVSVSLDFSLRISALRNCCWSPIRLRSPPKPTACRVRTNASACSPSMVCVPFDSFRCESGSSMSLPRQTSTPPTALVSVLTALKSATMKLSGLTPVSSVTVRMVQLGVRPSWPRLVLKRTCRVPGMTFCVPSSCVVGQSGTSTIRSRGMLSAVAFERSLETCSRIVVSACPTLPASP